MVQRLRHISVIPLDRIPSDGRLVLPPQLHHRGRDVDNIHRLGASCEGIAGSQPGAAAEVENVHAIAGGDAEGEQVAFEFAKGSSKKLRVCRGIGVVVCFGGVGGGHGLNKCEGGREIFRWW